MRVVGSTGLNNEVQRVAACPYCQAKNKIKWSRGDKFNVQRIATR